ncbi:MAG: hypothetical protein ACREIK_00775 [Nitrospiraceae bacterium]
MMKITMSWPGNRKTPKEKRVVHKPKIRWQQLGFKDLSEEPASISMDEIRRQVVVLSGRGLGHAARARAGEQSGPASGARTQGKANRAKRHGPTEQD